MFNQLRLLTFCLLTTLFFSGCGKESFPDDQYGYGEEETGEWPAGQNVFVAGYDIIEVKN